MLMAFGCRENLFHEPFLGSQNWYTASEKNLLEVTKQPHAATRDLQRVQYYYKSSKIATYMGLQDTG